MLSGVSMYAPARRLAALAMLLSVLCSIGSVGCDASPGLEPPSRRDGGPSPRPGSQTPDEGPGKARDAGLNTPGSPSGGSTGSISDAGAPTMMPPVITPGDDDAGT
jgi:hypothetical protein